MVPLCVECSHTPQCIPDPTFYMSAHAAPARKSSLQRTFIAALPMQYSPWVTWMTAGQGSYLWEVLALQMNANGRACALVYACAMILGRFSPCRTMHSRALVYTAGAIVHVHCLYLESVSAGKALLWTAQ